MISKITKKPKLRQPATVSSKPPALTLAPEDAKQIFSTVFEVFGTVQGVYFRKHTQSKAKQLGITGWCMNTKEGTVKGVIEGNLDKLNEMKHWLQHKGSPRSIIEKAVFSTNEPLPIHNFGTFTIRR
ncbi:acylphosphatase-2 [Drosophila tropicalis]|uniref:acylphosphatase-2 n=1 Tax=Drosophila tropicalis TaxID=46794 RepID=UPI0035ABF5F8